MNNRLVGEAALVALIREQGLTAKQETAFRTMLTKWHTLHGSTEEQIANISAGWLRAMLETLTANCPREQLGSM